jgi:predicted alpha/beta-fold hydrolase
VLLHGWEGSSKSAYQVTTANYLLKQGFDVLRLNLRDHGDSHHLNFELFNSTMTTEVAEAIACFFKTHPYEKRFLAGFSLGGNFTLRIAADHGTSLKLTAAAGICPPVDPTNAMTALDNTLFFYERYFFYRWSKSLRKKITHFPEHGFKHILNNARTIDDMNSFFIKNHTPFDSANSYFEAYSLIGDRLSELNLPAYLIASEDDPIIPAEDLKQINCPEKLSIELQQYGGHCGFIKNLSAHSWIENRLVDLFRGHL